MNIKTTYFTFTRGQRNGLLVLILIMLFLFMLRFYQPHQPVSNQYADSVISHYKSLIDTSLSESSIISKKEIIPFCPDTASVQSWIKMGFSHKQAGIIFNYVQKAKPLKSKEQLKKIFVISEEQFAAIEPFVIIDNPTMSLPDQKPAGSMFLFNPNSATDDDFINLGLNEGQIRAIRNYQKAGGSFQRKSDLEKIYAIGPGLFQKLQPYIELPADSLKIEEPETMVDLNSADSATLEKMKGIGPATAARIIRYREFLGGFYNKTQLLEIPGITHQQFIVFEPALLADTSKIKKININTSTIDQLNRHPYLTFDECKAIISYRKLMKKIGSPDVLLKNKLISKENYQKIKPYIEL